MASNRKIDIITAQKAAKMDYSSRVDTYRKQYRNMKDAIRIAEKKLDIDINERKFPTVGAFKKATPAQQARMIGALSSYRAELGTASTIIKRHVRTEEELRDPDNKYNQWFWDEDNEINHDRLGELFKIARAVWQGGKRTFDSGAVLDLYAALEDNNYSIRMFKDDMEALLEAAFRGTFNADNAGIEPGRRNKLYRTEMAFSEWKIPEIREELEEARRAREEK